MDRNEQISVHQKMFTEQKMIIVMVKQIHSTKYILRVTNPKKKKNHE